MDIEDYSQRFQFYDGDVPEILSSFLTKVKWTNLLDLGCGDGALLDALKNQGYLQGKSVNTVDLSESRIDLVRQYNPEFTCYVGDACSTKFSDSSMDFVISTQVIEHVDDDESLVREVYRLLKPGGIAYISTIFKKWYGWYFYRCQGKWVIDPTHLREYMSDEQLLDVFTRAELELIVSSKSLEYRSIVDFVMRRIGGNRDVYSSGILKSLRNIKLPILGYYCWELVVKKTDG